MAGYIDNSTDLALFGSYSQGRALAGARLTNLSRHAQWSALLDSKTCDWCSWADMRVFDTTIEPYDPPMHHGCRCLVAYITKDEFPPTADWGKGPPRSSWPPGSTGGCAPLTGKFSLRVDTGPGCIPTLPSEGMAVKPKINQVRIDSATEDWQKNLGQRFGSTQQRAKVPAGDIRKWQRQMLKDSGASANQIKAYDQFMANFTGAYPPELLEAYGAAVRGSADDFAAAMKKYVARLDERAAQRIVVGDIEPFRKMISEADEMVKLFQAQSDVTSEVIRRTALAADDGTITVFRGLKTRKSGDFVDNLKTSLVSGDTEQAIGSKTIESWTTDKAVAQKFAGSDGIVMSKKVPLEDVTNIWQTEGAFARHKESEILWSNTSGRLVPQTANQVGNRLEVNVW